MLKLNASTVMINALRLTECDYVRLVTTVDHSS